MKKTLHFRVWLVLLCLQMSIISYSQTQNHTIHFEVNQHTLNEEQTILLQEQISQLSYHSSTYQVEIIGHTDNKGSLSFNQKLSLERCKAAQQYLIAEGFDSTQLQIRAEAYKKPIAANQTDNGRAQNRRVELVFEYKTIEIPNQKWSFEANVGGTFRYDRSRTEIHIPQDALLYADGSTVTGKVDLYYKEFRDIPDFVYSGIPMSFEGMPFNSAGMFEIRAFQDGQALFVDPKKGFELDFVLTDTLPQLSFYEYNEQNKKWRAIEALNRQTQQNDLRGKLAANPFNNNILDGRIVDGNQNFDDANKNNRCPSDETMHQYFAHQDTLESFQKALELGIELTALNSLILPKYGDNYYLLFDERWERQDYYGTRFVGYSNNITSDNPTHFHIQLKKKKKLSRGRIELTIEDLTGENTELAALNNQRWYLKHRSRKKHKYRPTVFTQNWSNLMLYATNQGLKLNLKGANSFQKLSIYPILKRKERKNQKKIVQEIAKIVDQKRLDRATKFNQPLLDSNRLFNQFLAVDQLIKTDREHCYSYADWCLHIQNNKDSMQARYQKWLVLSKGKNGLDTINSLFKNMSFEPLAGRFAPNIYYPPSFEDETEEQRAKRVANEKGRLRNLANMVNQWQNRPNLDAGHTFPALVQKLTLDGFGIFNNDQIQILGKTKQLLASYKDKKGKKIDGKVLSMIDYTINGAMSFPPSNIAFNPKAKNAFLLFAKNGKQYLLRAEDLKKQVNLEATSCTFIMEDISKIKTAQALKKELGLDL